MIYFILKALLSRAIVAVVSELARRSLGFGALFASLPLVSILGMIWLWHDTHDQARLSAHVGATFWYVIPSLPMFLLMPVLMRHGIQFWWALAAGCALTFLLYTAVTLSAAHLGIVL